MTDYFHEETFSQDPILSFGSHINQLSKNWGWVLFLGVVYVILGVIAYAAPIASTIVLTMTLGVVLVVGGIIQLIHAFRFGKEAGSGGRFFHSFVSLVSGALMLRYPGAGMMALAMILSFYFLMSAFAKWSLAISVRPNKGWGWLFVGSILSFLLGAYIIASFPISALWIPGALLGIDFVVSGFTMIGASGHFRRLNKTLSAQTQAEKQRKIAA